MGMRGGAQWGILWDHGGGGGLTGFCHHTPLVFHGENGQNEYILIIFSFTNIV